MNEGKIPFHKYMAWKIENCGMTQKELATKLGYKNPNNITMLKKGSTRFPVDKIPAFAKELGLDPAKTLRLCLEEYNPELLDAIDLISGTLISQNERYIITKLREYTGESDPAINSVLKDDFLRDFAKKITN